MTENSSEQRDERLRAFEHKWFGYRIDELVMEDIQDHIRQHYVPLDKIREMLANFFESICADADEPCPECYKLYTLDEAERILSEYGYSAQPAEEENGE